MQHDVRTLMWNRFSLLSLVLWLHVLFTENIKTKYSNDHNYCKGVDCAKFWLTLLLCDLHWYDLSGFDHRKELFKLFLPQTDDSQCPNAEFPVFMYFFFFLLLYFPPFHNLISHDLIDKTKLDAKKKLLFTQAITFDSKESLWIFFSILVYKKESQSKPTMI